MQNYASDLSLDLPAESSVKFTLSVKAKAAELFPITGLTDAQLRQIQLQKNSAGAPWFPKPVRGDWLTVPTLRGWAEWREARAAKTATPKIDGIQFPSMEACEGATGITKTLQQLAKTNGCSAFRSPPRVYLIDLIKWIFINAATGQIADWGKLGIELDTKLKQVKLDTELRELIKLSEAGDSLQKFAAIVFNGVKRLEMESPRDFEMRPRDYIKKVFAVKRRTIFDQAKNELQKLLAETEKFELAENKSP